MSGIRMGGGSATPTEGRAAPQLAGVNVHNVLTTIFNCFALNGLFVIACLPVVTIPVALWAAVVTLGRWRDEGEPSVAREFLRQLRGARWRRVSVTVGVPLLATVLAAVEIQFCLHAGGPSGLVCVALGAAGAFICVAGIGYSVMLCVARPDLASVEVWSAAVALAARHALGASLLLVAGAGLIALLLVRDASLSVVCVPLGYVALLRATAGRPVSRLVAAEAADVDDGRELSKFDSEEVVGR